MIVKRAVSTQETMAATTSDFDGTVFRMPNPSAPLTPAFSKNVPRLARI